MAAATARVPIWPAAGWIPRGTSFPRLVAGTLGFLLTQGEVLAFMAFPTARPPGGSPTLSVLKTRVCGRFRPLWMDPSRNLLSTAFSRHPWGSPTPRGGPALRGTPTVLPIGYRHAVGLETWVSVSYLGLYTWAIQPTPIEASIMLVRFSCAGFWVVVLLELLQVSPRSPEHLLSLRGLGA